MLFDCFVTFLFRFSLYSVKRKLEGALPRWASLLYHCYFQGSAVVCERISRADFQHLKRLRGLHHPHLVPIFNVSSLDSHGVNVEIVSKYVQKNGKKTRWYSKTHLLVTLIFYLTDFTSESLRKPEGIRTWWTMQAGGHNIILVSGGVCSSFPSCKPHCTWRSSSWIRGSNSKR